MHNILDNNILYQQGGGKKQRNSSIELFRILATFLVLIVHLNGWIAGGLVDWSDANITSLHKVTQLIIQSLCVVCVNCFLIISGWYGLNLKFASIWKIWVLLFSIYVPFYLLSCMFGCTDFSIFTFIKNSLAFPCESYFVQNYVMLMFISPVLNSFIEKHGVRHLTIFSLTLFAIEAIMESVFQNQSLYIKNGYSLFHFITMYFLARTAYMHRNKILAVNKHYWVLGYFLCAALVCLLHFTPYKHNWAYSNPIIIIESFMLFFPFLYRTFYNNFINWVAGGSLAVYVIQVTNPVCGKLFVLDQYILAHFSYTTYLIIMLFSALLFWSVCLLYNEAIQSIIIHLVKPLRNHIEVIISKFV